MNIETIQENLKNTIAGKEAMLKSHTAFLKSSGMDGLENTIVYATVEFLKINLEELKNILKDVEKCIPEKMETDPWKPPANCRQRLMQEGKAYAKSSCAVCGDFAPNWKVCEEALPKKIDPITRSEGNMKYSPNFVAGWNACVEITKEVAADLQDRIIARLDAEAEKFKWDLIIRDCDFKTDVLTAHRGGFSLGTESKIRITHTPTGIYAECNEHRSQHANRAKAWDDIIKKLVEMGGRDE